MRDCAAAGASDDNIDHLSVTRYVLVTSVHITQPSIADCRRRLIKLLPLTLGPSPT